MVLVAKTTIHTIYHILFYSAIITGAICSASFSQNAESINYALFKPVVVSSVEGSSCDGSKAVDGNSASSRWSSAFSDPQWIYVNLENKYAITRIKIDWENANAKNYSIQGSVDAVSWTTLITKTNMAPGNHRIDDISGLSGTYQYIRIYGTARTTPYGYSIWELEIYGTLDAVHCTVASSPPTAGDIVLSPAGGSYTSGTPVTLSAAPRTGFSFLNWSGDTISFINPLTIMLNSDKHIIGNFIPRTYAIVSSASAGGAISPLGTVMVPHGANQTYLFTPDSGKTIESVSVDGVVVGTSSYYTFTNITSAHSISVTFVPGRTPPPNTSEQINISGDLFNDDGSPVGSPFPATLKLTVDLYDSVINGKKIYTQTFDSVKVIDGYFNVWLSRTSEGRPIADILSILNLWVQITIDDGSTNILEPRTPLTAAAYSIKGRVLNGVCDPVISVPYADIGTYFINTAAIPNSTWVRTFSGWVKLN